LLDHVVCGRKINNGEEDKHRCAEQCRIECREPEARCPE
jgi:hypothetical protein